MSRKWFTVLALALATAAFPHGANAGYWNIDIKPGTNDGAPFGFGTGSVETFGQTFTIPKDHAGDNILDFFTFDLRKDTVSTNAVNYKAYVMAWNSDKATGNILWQSQEKTLTNSLDFQKYTFDTLGLELTGGVNNQYVAFVSATSPKSSGAMQILRADGYGDGDFRTLDDGANASESGVGWWNTQTWQTLTLDGQSKPADAVFAAYLRGTNDARTPEPASLALIGMGLLAPGLRRRRAARKAKKA